MFTLIESEDVKKVFVAFNQFYSLFATYAYVNLLEGLRSVSFLCDDIATLFSLFPLQKVSADLMWYLADSVLSMTANLLCIIISIMYAGDAIILLITMSSVLFLLNLINFLKVVETYQEVMEHEKLIVPPLEVKEKRDSLKDSYKQAVLNLYVQEPVESKYEDLKNPKYENSTSQGDHIYEETDNSGDHDYQKIYNIVKEMN